MEHSGEDTNSENWKIPVKEIIEVRNPSSWVWKYQVYNQKFKGEFKINKKAVHGYFPHEFPSSRLLITEVRKREMFSSDLRLPIYLKWVFKLLEEVL